MECLWLELADSHNFEGLLVLWSAGGLIVLSLWKFILWCHLLVILARSILPLRSGFLEGLPPHVHCYSRPTCIIKKRGDTTWHHYYLYVRVKTSFLIFTLFRISFNERHRNETRLESVMQYWMNVLYKSVNVKIII